MPGTDVKAAMSLDTLRSSLRGKVAIVTGASSGVGWAVSHAFAAEGVHVVATARRMHRLERLAAEIHAKAQGAEQNDGAFQGTCVLLPGDAADPVTAEAAVALALERFGRVDILVNNAGVGNYKQMVDTSLAEYDELMNTNMRSSFLFTRAVAPHLVAQRSGTLIFISSVAGLTGTANEAVYCASKFAQAGFADSVAEELTPYGIKVTTLFPGGLKTEFAVGRGRTQEGVARSRMMDPCDFADAVLFASMQPANVRIPRMVVRHMGQPK